MWPSALTTWGCGCALWCGLGATPASRPMGSGEGRRRADRSRLSRPRRDGGDSGVHCAAKVGDWGPVDDYVVNVAGSNTSERVESAGSLRHLCTCQFAGVLRGPAIITAPTNLSDPARPAGRVTLTKVSPKNSCSGTSAKESGGRRWCARDSSWSAATVPVAAPAGSTGLKTGQVKYFGSGEQLMNNTFVGISWT